jgi:deazaflavin-dependent oxidoreductase (nitroreductase family)
MSTSFNDFNRALINDLREHEGKATSGPFLGADVLILTTHGAKSGEVRENPLAFSRKGHDYVIIASKGGAPTHPSWYHNLLANPIVTIEVLGKKIKAKASAAPDDEYETLYSKHAAKMPGFNEYRTKTTRKIPVVILEPIE